MTNTERAAMIRAWHETMVELTSKMGAFAALTGAAPDSPLVEAVWLMAGDYTAAVDRIAGDDGSLSWFWLECELGARPKTCSTPAGVDHRIATIDDMIAFIEACEEQP